MVLGSAAVSRCFKTAEVAFPQAGARGKLEKRMGAVAQRLLLGHVEDLSLDVKQALK